MSTFDYLQKIPALNSRIVCISGNPEIAAVISSYFNRNDEYFCVLEHPRLERHDKTNEVIKRNNVIARLQPDYIIYAGLKKEAEEELNTFLSSKNPISISKMDEIEEKIGYLRIEDFDGVLECTVSDIYIGLLLAKRANKRLKITETAQEITNTFVLNQTTKHLVILDDLKEAAPVIAANYAYSIGAEIYHIPEPSENDIDLFYDDVVNSSELKDQARGQESERNLASTQYKIDDNFDHQPLKARFITFITRGMPYGYFYPDIPSTHLYSYPELGIFIANSIYDALFEPLVKSAVIVNPGFFKKTETADLKKSLDNSGVFIQALEGKDAIVHNTSMHIQWFPYDFLFICSHAGQMEGRRLKIKFKDRDGLEHILVAEQAIGLALTDEGEGVDRIVDVQSHLAPIELDGIAWNNKSGKSSNTSEIMEDFLKIELGKWDIIEKVDIKHVRYSKALQLTDNQYQPSFHLVASHRNPIVFNNCCVTFSRFSQSFIFAGAKFYIGTLTNVDNSDAINVAELVFGSNLTKLPLPVNLWRAQKKVYTNPLKRVYLSVGCHFTAINLPDKIQKDESRLFVKDNIEQSARSLMKKIKKGGLPEDVLKNVNRALRFLGKVHNNL